MKKTCFVPVCKNNSDTAPNKIFVYVPKQPELRKQWCDAVGCKKQFSSINCFCCEDHFNIPEDAENFIQYKFKRSNLKIKNGVLPTKYIKRSFEDVDFTQITPIKNLIETDFKRKLICDSIKILSTSKQNLLFEEEEQMMASANQSTICKEPELSTSTSKRFLQIQPEPSLCSSSEEMLQQDAETFMEYKWEKPCNDNMDISQAQVDSVGLDSRKKTLNKNIATKKSNDTQSSFFETIFFVTDESAINKECRICLGGDGTFQSIFNNSGVDSISFADMIMSSFSSANISVNDGLPDEICSFCAEKISELYNFKIKFEQNDLILRSRNKAFCDDTADIKPQIDPNLSITDNPNDNILKSIKKEILDEDYEVLVNDVAEVQTFEKNNDCGTIRLVSREDPPLLVCPVCNQTFTKKKDLKIHKLNAHLVCNMCNIALPSRNTLTLHRKNCKKRKCSCDICDKLGRTNIEKQKQPEEFQAKKPYECGVCLRTFWFSFALKVHEESCKEELIARKQARTEEDLSIKIEENIIVGLQ